MSETVEEVTNAIASVMRTESFDGTDDEQRALHREAAIAALRALRNAPKSAWTAFYDRGGEDGIQQYGLEQFIDAVLGTQSEMLWRK